MPDRRTRSIKSLLLKMVHFGRYAYRTVYYKIRFFGRPVNVDGSTYLSRRAVIRTNGGGSITIGKNCEIHDFSIMMTYGGSIVLGDDTSLNPFSVVYGHGGVVIGRGVRIATQAVIIPGNHNKGSDSVALIDAGHSMLGIEIKDNVWLGAGVRVLDGVTIGENSVVGAGSVVTKPVDKNTTVGGVPARVLKTANGQVDG